MERAFKVYPSNERVTHAVQTGRNTEIWNIHSNRSEFISLWQRPLMTVGYDRPGDSMISGSMASDN